MSHMAQHGEYISQHLVSSITKNDPDIFHNVKKSAIHSPEKMFGTFFLENVWHICQKMFSTFLIEL